MKNKLNTENITNELEGASLFFTRAAIPSSVEVVSPEKQSSPIIESPTPIQTQSFKEQPEIAQKPETPKSKRTTRRDTTTPRYHGIKIPRHHRFTA